VSAFSTRRHAPTTRESWSARSRCSRPTQRPPFRLPRTGRCWQCPDRSERCPGLRCMTGPGRQPQSGTC
jgi:hypothetical protein